jgi:hypothetical protein
MFLLWARAMHFAERAAMILEDDKYLWQAAQLPVFLYREAAFAKTKRPQFLIDKLFTVASPVSLEHFAPDLRSIRCYYNLYSSADLRCSFLGDKAAKQSRECSMVNLAIQFDHAILPAGHIKMLNSCALARWIPSIHEQIQNPTQFQFGVPGELTIFKSVPPLYAAGKVTGK